MAASQINTISLESEQIARSAFRSSAKPTTGDKDAATTFISNVDQLEKEHPAFFKGFVENMAREICRELHKHAKRMKSIMRENIR